LEPFGIWALLAREAGRKAKKLEGFLWDWLWWRLREPRLHHRRPSWAAELVQVASVVCGGAGSWSMMFYFEEVRLGRSS
jgi:hypothetical protein